MTEKQTTSEETVVPGEQLLAKVKELIHEGNVRAVILKREDGTTILQIPLNAGLAVGVLATAMAPVLVAVGAIAAMVSQITLVVEREAPDAEPPALTDQPGDASQ